MKCNYFVFISLLLSQCTPDDKTSQPTDVNQANEFEVPSPYMAIDSNIRDTILKYYTLGDYNTRKKIFNKLEGDKDYWFGDKHGYVGRIKSYRDDAEVFRDSIASLMIVGKKDWSDGPSLLYHSRELAITKSSVAETFFLGMLQDTSYIFHNSTILKSHHVCIIKEVILMSRFREEKTILLSMRC